MSKVKIISPGKIKEQWLSEALNEYVKRLRPNLEVEFVWAKDDAQLKKYVEGERAAVCLDVEGRMMSSGEFSEFFFDKLEESGARLSFVIGGPDGLPSTLKEGYPLISLSSLTLTHQFARLLLVEQIYRAVEIRKGSPYHK